MIDRKDEYDRMAAVEENLWWYKCLHHLVLRQVEEHFESKNVKIVDAGCGTGGLMNFLIKHQYSNIQGLDISRDAINICKKAKLNVFTESIQNIKSHFRDRSIDLIISNDTFYFLSEMERKKLLRDFYELLNPNGLVILNVPALKAFRGIHDISVGIQQRFSKKDIKAMIFGSEFKVVKLLFWPFFLSPVILLSRFWQRIKLKTDKNTPIISDIDMPSKGLNNLLFKIVDFENKILSHKPFGSSLFLVLQKKS